MQILERQPLLDAVNNALDATGDEHLRLHENYSGRGMYGRKCVGISADSLGSIVVAIVHIATEYNQDIAANMAESLRTDGYGKGMIAYFPGFQIEPSDEKDDSKALSTYRTCTE